MTQLLDIGFAGSIVYGGSTLGKDGSHDDIGRSCYRGLIEQHIATFELVGMDLIDIALFVEIELRSQVLESEEVRVETSTSYLVTTGFGNDRPAIASQQRTDHQYATAKGGTFAYELIALQIVEVKVGGLKTVVVTVQLVHLDTDLLQQQDQVVHIQDIRDVLDDHLLIGEQGGTNHLQSLVLRPLWRNGTLQQMSAFDSK